MGLFWLFHKPRRLPPPFAEGLFPFPIPPLRLLPVIVGGREFNCARSYFGLVLYGRPNFDLTAALVLGDLNRQPETSPRQPL